MAAGGAANMRAEAADIPIKAPVRIEAAASVVPYSGFYIGLGGGVATNRFGDQDVFAVGTSNVFTNGVLSSSGSASGPANISMETKTSVAFSAQGGYFQRFAGSQFVWGAKFAYSYFDATATTRNALLPQAGSFTPTGSTTPVPFTGNALVQSFQTSIVQQIAFMPFIGHAYDRGFIYLGAGPTVSQMRTNLIGVIGFADLNGNRTDVSGAPVNLTSTSWVWGGAATIGTTYFLDRNWFVDVNYTAGTTAKHTSNYFSPFTNPNGTNGSVITGTLVGTDTAKVLTQAVIVTINRVF
jgi:hypothetical protein